MHPLRTVQTLSTFALAAVLLSVGTRASATTFIVTDFGDSGASGQLRSLIDAAAPGDTILIPPGTIVLTGEPAEDANAEGDLDILKNLTIIGSGADLTIIDADRVDRVFDIRPAVTVTIAGVALRNGWVDPAAAVDPSGGGLLNRGVSTTLVNVIVERSFAGGGGGIANFAGTVVLSGSAVRNNSSTGITANGGGILNFAKLEVTHSTVSGNTVFGTSASTLGGGIINAGTMSMRDSTVAGNAASGTLGGGIYQTPFAGPLDLVNVTIAGNRAGTASGHGFGGGLANSLTAPVTVVNTLIADNDAGPAGSGPDCSGAITSLGHNLVQDTSGCTIAAGLGDIFGRRAGLRTFGDNGGPTETFSLKVGSRAVDAGDNAVCGVPDQRGVTRPVDGDADGVAVCDIGAFEFVR